MEVVKDLTCPICLEFYTHPIILPCSHVLCRRPCAENIFEVNFIRCPVCRDNCYISGGITSLPRVITIESIIEKIRAERKKRAVANKTKRDTSSSSDFTNEDTSTEDILADLIPKGRSHDFPPIRSPSISSSRGIDQSSSMSTPQGFSPLSISPPLQPHRLLQLLNLQLTMAPYGGLGISEPSSLLSSLSAANHGPEISSISSTDREIQSILCRDNNTRTTGHHHQHHQVHPQPQQQQHQQPLPSQNHCRESPRQRENPPVSTNQNASQNDAISFAESHLNRPRAPQPMPAIVTAESCHNAITRPVSGERIGADGTVSSSSSTQNETILARGESLESLSVERGESHEVIIMKHEIQEQLQRLCDVQCQLLLYLTSYKDKADGLQDVIDKRRSEINTECDSLVAEIEHKRNHFLENIEDESTRTQIEVDDVSVATEKLLTSTQQLACFAEQILEAREDVLVQAAPDVLDRLSTSVKECELCLMTSEPRFRSIVGHRVDLRNERALLRNINYLKVPSKPIIDVDKCTRNSDTVVLVLAPPTSRDVIDSYEISYSSEEQKRLGIEERHYARWPLDTTSKEGSSQFVLIENLCRTTHYYFSACAVNREGRSQSSDHVQCVTLGQHECVVPVPAIMQSSCHAFSDHVYIKCPSPVNVAVHQGVSHYALYREEGGAYLWQGEELQAREEHRISRLHSNTDYQFVILACNGRGECQVSEKISLRTSAS